ncbi:unnamed protein product [Gongylonema pulchrum]|uniref:G_PROTEIN_RECEP_F1_2 domain-containing protein n=1 Tax=Gongylonema pulchrum TaxID=637853 RepID=A0A183DIN1_9BILA|nr:unnamed protein product [Gongylonema pulchrum]
MWINTLAVSSKRELKSEDSKKCPSASTDFNYKRQLQFVATLLRLNVDKLLLIQFPLHYYTMVNRAKLISVCTVTWAVITALAMAVYYFMAFISEPVEFCHV